MMRLVYNNHHRSGHRDNFFKYLFFFSRSNVFMNFQEDNRSVRRTHVISQESFSIFARTHNIFPGSHTSSSTNFPEALFSHRTDQFFLVLSSHPAHTIFQETLCHRTDWHFFLEGIPIEQTF